MIPFTRLLFLLVIIGILSFSVRISEVVTGISDLSPRAYAKADEYESEANSAHEDSGEDAVAEEKVTPSNPQEPPKWRDASDSDFDISDVRMDMFEDLSERRAALEKMEKEYYVREALLKAAEKELQRKYQELDALKSEIEGLLETQSEEEKERIDSLVKIYEGMKPKEAARIFDTLDIDILVSVLSKMSTRKVSPVLAAMNPERARTVTIMLAEEKTLPSL